jgi:hypothetical protein
MSAFLDLMNVKMYYFIHGPGPVMIIESADVHAGWLAAHEVLHFLRVELEKRVKQ